MLVENILNCIHFTQVGSEPVLILRRLQNDLYLIYAGSEKDKFYIVRESLSCIRFTQV